MIKKPSVSKLVKILDKPALVGWANKIGLEGVNLKAYRTKAMADGSNIHAQIHDSWWLIEWQKKQIVLL